MGSTRPPVQDKAGKTLVVGKMWEDPLSGRGTNFTEWGKYFILREVHFQISCSKSTDLIRSSDYSKLMLVPERRRSEEDINRSAADQLQNLYLKTTHHPSQTPEIKKKNFTSEFYSS